MASSVDQQHTTIALLSVQPGGASNRGRGLEVKAGAAEPGWLTFVRKHESAARCGFVTRRKDIAVAHHTDFPVAFSVYNCTICK